MEKFCWEVFIDHIHPYLDIDTRINCKFISKIPLDFNTKYFEMRTRYVIERIPPFIHIGGRLLQNGIDFTLPITQTKILVTEISEYHTNIHISDANTYELIYEEFHIT